MSLSAVAWSGGWRKVRLEEEEGGRGEEKVFGGGQLSLV